MCRPYGESSVSSRAADTDALTKLNLTMRYGTDNRFNPGGSPTLDVN